MFPAADLPTRIQSCVLLLLCMGYAFPSASHIHYVQPAEGTPCPVEPCYNLSHYLLHPELYLIPNTTLLLLPGLHILESEMRISNVKNLSLIGSKSATATLLPNTTLWYAMPTTEIVCTDKGGLGFSASYGVTISHLRMKNCSYGMGFICVVNVNLLGIVIENSTTAAIYAERMLGNSSILKSVFLNNTAHVTLYYVDEECPNAVPQTTTTAFLDSYFLFSNQTLLSEAGGMTIKLLQSTFDVEMKVSRCSFLSNFGNIEGGNMGVAMLTSSGRKTVIIDSSIFAFGRAISGAGLYLYVSKNASCNNSLSKQQLCKLQITNSTFVSNSAVIGDCLKLNIIRSLGMDLVCASGGGLRIFLIATCYPCRVDINNTVFRNNSAELFGGNIATLNIVKYILPVQNSISISHSLVESGSSGADGGGLHAQYIASSTQEPNPNIRQNISKSENILQVTHTDFMNNVALGLGGGVSLQMTVETSTVHEVGSLSFMLRMIFNSCIIENNTATTSPGVIILGTPKASPFEVAFTNVLFCYQTWYDLQVFPRTISVTDVNVLFTNCSFYHNNGTALQAVRSSVYFQGQLTFFNNSGSMGGALLLSDAFMYLQNNTNVSFIQNHASKYGGAIFAQQHLDQAASTTVPICFFQLDVPDFTNINSLTIQVILQSNTAENGGSAIYGASVDNCLSLRTLEYHREVIRSPEGIAMFDLFFKVFPQFSNDTSVISSDPLGICFCINSKQTCDLNSQIYTLYPGDTIGVSLVTVGQRRGTVAGTVEAQIKGDSSNSRLLEFQDSQSVNMWCTTLQYTVLSVRNSLEIELNLPITVDSFSLPKVLLLSFLSCPPGFNLTDSGVCDCVQVLLYYDVKCNITGQVVHRTAPLWIGYAETYSNNTMNQSTNRDGTVVHDHCPLGYCKSQDIDITLNNTDVQCALNHSGILCGACRHGFSMALGSLRCLKCSNVYLLLVLGFGVAGMGLVALLTICNITVAEGTLNTLVFYANIIQINRPYFFPTRNSVVTVFIAWINLDLGVETCFYSGIDMYAKAWLQFVFPLYIWLIVVAMIISSHYYTTAARLFSRNAPKVLATLFLLSYAKLLRAVITVFSFTLLEYPDGTEKALWLYDGNVDYLRGKHIPLFLVALAVLLVFLLPYTLIVLFTQCIQKKSWHRALAWVRRLKPIFDAYAGPYKDKYRFWTGFLLLVRVVLSLMFAINVLGNPVLNLVFIIIVSMCLLALEWIFCWGIYKKWPLDILEAVSLLNLGIFSTLTVYVQVTGGDQFAIANVSGSIEVIIFAGILIYQSYYRLNSWLHLSERCSKWKRRSTELPNMVHIDSNEVPENEGNQIRTQPRVRQLRLTINENDEVELVEDDS